MHPLIPLPLLPPLSPLSPLSPLLLLSVLCLLAGAARAETLDGRITAIVDGDTLSIDVPARGQLRVRLAWIDAPDRLQAHGEAARSSLGALASGQAVRIETVADSRGGSGGEMRATVFAAAPGCHDTACPKTVDLGFEQIARGMAWHDRRALGQPAPALARYEEAEFAAKIHRLGLWAGKNPAPPWAGRGPR